MPSVEGAEAVHLRVGEAASGSGRVQSLGMGRTRTSGQLGNLTGVFHLSTGLAATFSMFGVWDVTCRLGGKVPPLVTILTGGPGVWVSFNQLEDIIVSDKVACFRSPAGGEIVLSVFAPGSRRRL